MAFPYESASAQPRGSGDRSPLAFERRRCPRLAAGGSFVISYREESGDGSVGIARVELLDSSPCGLGLRSKTPLPPGTRVALFIQGNTLPGRTGVVVRCERVGEHYCAGLSCDAQVAA